ncbi:nuclear transport factor 2 family protein [Calothrix sp. NIES-2098]|uniref:nuclear transport factor 2 family protein n=1 Tax=Calothrix sp. NIES-2098 TaxID=1954171 RepID=UPI000B61A832|nr:steroid delta-5-3-ketosteroid isomerase [Calothrix sp. NIES-2098]
MSSEVIQKVIAEYFAATRAMDLNTWLSTFAPDAISYEPERPALTNHDALSKLFQDIAGLFEKVGLQEESIFITNNQAAVKWTGYGIGKNGREVTFEGIDIFEINELGKIQKMWAYWHPAAMIAQLQGNF